MLILLEWFLWTFLYVHPSLLIPVPSGSQKELATSYAIMKCIASPKKISSIKSGL